MTDTAWKPTPGRDAMTRDGRRATGLLRKPTFGNYVFVGEVDGATSTWTEVGKYYQAEGLSSDIDLVADWSDADPLPDADAAQHANWTVVEWSASIRPAPSGPVVEETVKRIVPGVYGRLRVWEEATDDTGDRVARVTFASRNGGHSMGASPVFLTRSELLAAAETLRQIGDAMEGK